MGSERPSSLKYLRYLALVSVMILILGLASWAAITTTRFSNTGAAPGEADGLLPGGDRHNSYAWSMETMQNTAGDEYLYVGSNRDIISLLMKDAGESFEDIYNAFSGDLSVPDPVSPDVSGRIFRKNTNGTGDWEIVYTSPMLPEPYDEYPVDLGYRGVESYAAPGEALPSLYFGTMGTISTRLLKLGPDFQPGDKPVTVYQTTPMTSASLRSMAVYDYGSGNKLYMGVMKPNNNPASADLQILESTNPVSNDWQQVAFLSDFPGARTNTNTVQYGGIWDMIAFNGYLYAFVGSNHSGEADDGFMVFKGKPVSEGTLGRNAAGWLWEPIVASGIGRYPNGLGNKSNVTASPFIYSVGGKEYVYVGTFADVISPMTESVESYLDSLYPCQVYRFDSNDNWEMIIGNPEDSNGVFMRRLGNFGAGFFNVPATAPAVDLQGTSPRELSMNQYAWRMGVYNNKLYVTTFDMGVMLDYAENFTDDPTQKAAIRGLVAALRAYNTNPSGFDLYYTSDGLNFTAITTDGFGDKFNYGGRTVRVKGAGDALFIGTANPFYGCQVWKITDTEDPQPSGGGGGGGCNTGFAALALLGVIPLLIFRKKQ